MALAAALGGLGVMPTSVGILNLNDSMRVDPTQAMTDLSSLHQPIAALTGGAIGLTNAYTMIKARKGRAVITPLLAEARRLAEAVLRTKTCPSALQARATDLIEAIDARDKKVPIPSRTTRPSQSPFRNDWYEIGSA